MDNAPSFKIMQQAIENGMVTMLQDGVLKVLEHQTSLEEVYRVIGNFDYVEELYKVAISQTISQGIEIGVKELDKARSMINDKILVAKTIKEIPTNEIIVLLLSLAIESKAGDLHIEPTAENVKIRFRIDGILHDMFELSKDIFLPLLAEIKILAGLPLI